ncbi:Serine/threonine-protein phosphatase [Aphelenchoides besseyi]|nr:Serine/threonine-protein phosphatase [Aphelenchoides besseyi]
MKSINTVYGFYTECQRRYSLRLWQTFKTMQRPIEPPDTLFLTGFLWSDPNPAADGWHTSSRSVAQTSGVDVVKEFCARMDIYLITRADQIVHGVNNKSTPNLSVNANAPSGNI